MLQNIPRITVDQFRRRAMVRLRETEVRRARGTVKLAAHALRAPPRMKMGYFQNNSAWQEGW